MTSPIEYRLNAPVSPEAAAELFRRAGLRRPVDDLPRLTAMLQNANVTLSAWDGIRLVGIARGLTDFVYCCYLSDLAVDPDYQGQGIGRELTLRMKTHLGEQVTLYLVSVPDAMGFYERIGMESNPRLFMLPRSG